MKQFIIKFVIAGTRELRTGLFSAKSKKIVTDYVIAKYGYCSYINILSL